MSSPENAQTNIKNLLVNMIVILVIFVVTMVVLVWAAKQISGFALALIMVVGVLIILVEIVTVLVMTGYLRQKWAMDFYNAVLAKIPMLKFPQIPVSDTELQDNLPSDSD